MLQLTMIGGSQGIAASVVGVVLLLMTVGVALIARWVGLRFDAARA
jgi:hypothetical protein